MQISSVLEQRECFRLPFSIISPLFLDFMQVLLLLLPVVLTTRWDDLELNPLHLKYSIGTDEALLNSCEGDDSCPVKVGKRELNTDDVPDRQA